MSTMPLSGTIVDAAGRGCRARIAGLAADFSTRVVTHSDEAGRWQLPEDDAVRTLIGVRSDDGIAAVSTVAAPGAALVLPPTLACSFEFDGGASNTQVWLNPLQLDHFDDMLLPALHAGPAGSIVLHVGSFDAVPRVLQLQAGRYRVSGGRIAIHPGAEMGLVVSDVIDLFNGQPLARSAGDWLLQIRQAGRYRVRFGEAPRSPGR
jgi:hypothetical protein